MLHVPYNGLAPVMQALVGGHIDVAITNLVTSLPLANDGKIKILAVAQSEPFEGAPDIPPITKAMPSFAFPKAFYGYYGPPGLPAPVASKLAGEIGKVLAMTDVKVNLAKMALVPMMMSVEEFGAMVKSTGNTFQRIIESETIQLK
jgi:tripartite-type tricarboxylate transporter receptor subunit TctC